MADVSFVIAAWNLNSEVYRCQRVDEGWRKVLVLSLDLLIISFWLVIRVSQKISIPTNKRSEHDKNYLLKTTPK